MEGLELSDEFQETLGSQRLRSATTSRDVLLKWRGYIPTQSMKRVNEKTEDIIGPFDDYLDERGIRRFNPPGTDHPTMANAQAPRIGSFASTCIGSHRFDSLLQVQLLPNPQIIIPGDY